MCYALGGVGEAYTCLNQPHYAPVDDLLQNAKLACQYETHRSAWKRIADTPTYEPTTAGLAGKLLVIGGRNTSEGGADMKEVYMYSPSTNSWIYISGSFTMWSCTAAVAVLSSTESLVIGGWCGSDRVSTVFKGTLRLKV